MKVLAVAGRFAPGGGILPHDVVIRDKGEGQHQRYVVHYKIWHENGNLQGFNDGGYHDGFKDAWDDFSDRVTRATARYGVPRNDT